MQTPTIILLQLLAISPADYKTKLETFEKKLMNVETQDFEKVFEDIKDDMIELIKLSYKQSQNLDLSNIDNYLETTPGTKAENLQYDILFVYRQIAKVLLQNIDETNIDYEFDFSDIEKLTIYTPRPISDYIKGFYKNSIEFVFYFNLLTLYNDRKINLDKNKLSDLLLKVRYAFENYAANSYLLGMWQVDEDTEHWLERNILITSSVIESKAGANVIVAQSIEDLFEEIENETV